MNERYEIDNLKELLAKKKLEVYANKDNIMDREKIYAIEDLLNNDRCFFNLKFNTAISILKFLGIDDKDILDVYNRITDPNLLKPRVRFIRK